MTLYLRNLHNPSQNFFVYYPSNSKFMVKPVGDYYCLQAVLDCFNNSFYKKLPIDILCQVPEVFNPFFSKNVVYYSQKEIFQHNTIMVGSYRSKYVSEIGYREVNFSPGMILVQNSISGMVMVHKDNVESVRLSYLKGEKELDPEDIELWLYDETYSYPFYNRVLRKLKSQAVMEGVRVVQDSSRIEELYTNIEPLYTTPESFDQFLLEVKTNLISLYQYGSQRNKYSDFIITHGSSETEVGRKVKNKIDELGFEFIEETLEVERRRTYIVGSRRI